MNKVFNSINEEIVLSKIQKLKPLKYNQFYWWRRFAPKNSPLPKNAPLWDVIINGDLDFSHYYWQALYSEMEINEKYAKVKDQHMYIESTIIDRERRAKLWADFEKDEKTKLQLIKKLFLRNFFITSEEYEKEITIFIEDLREFYFYCKLIYGKRPITSSRRGRPTKNKK